MYFVVYKSLQKKFCLICSYEIKNPYGAARVRITRAEDSLQPRGTRGSWSSLGWL